MTGFLIVNPRGGDGAAADELCSAAAALGIETHVLRPDDDARELARQAGADAIGIAPTADACGSPFSNRIIIGIDATP